MIVAVHQPHFLPWLGYLDRMRQVDLFVVLDHVQFEKQNYQNRTAILVDGTPRWLTVPIQQQSFRQSILEKRVANPPASKANWWGPNMYATLRHAYRRTPHFRQYGAWLQEVLERRWDYLTQLNEVLLEFLRHAFDINTPLVRSSSLKVEGARSELVLNICRAVGADTFLCGGGGSRRYLDVGSFERAGVRVEYQQFRHPVYPQRSVRGAPGFTGSAGPFVPGLSAVDMLFNCGAASRDLLAPAAQPLEKVLAAA
jgi:hypothetical protein